MKCNICGTDRSIHHPATKQCPDFDRGNPADSELWWAETRFEPELPDATQENDNYNFQLGRSSGLEMASKKAEEIAVGYFVKTDDSIAKQFRCLAKTFKDMAEKERPKRTS